MLQNDTLYETLFAPAGFVGRPEAKDTLHATWQADGHLIVENWHQLTHAPEQDSPATGQDSGAAVAEHVRARPRSGSPLPPVFTPWSMALLPSALAPEQANTAAENLRHLDQEVQCRLKAEEAEWIAQQEAERRVRAHTARLRFLEQDRVASTVAPTSFPTGNWQRSMLELDTRTPSIDARAPSFCAPPSSPQVFYADAHTEGAEDWAAATLCTPTECSLPQTPFIPMSSHTLPIPMEIPRPRPAVDTKLQPHQKEQFRQIEVPQPRSHVSLNNVCNDTHFHMPRV